ncbi:hypothetical protein FFLO_04924 [Filobasidium floriforme]|uniref:Uncharacterized protein n=1 Tax=Filobasidium floriforme TaxID=5210 RepID=A0A8K0JHU5_9TREE|nr:hypothetical protein FFLO_04924 [Filobasidium floriforme]
MMPEDSLFPQDWHQFIDVRFDERDLLAGVRGISQFLDRGFRPITKHIHVLFFIIFERHAKYLLAADEHDARSGRPEPLVTEAIYTLARISLNVNHASSLADAIPSGQRMSELLDYDVDPRSVFEGARTFMMERVEPFGGTVWGLVLTPASSKSKDEYEIEAGGWRILAWLVDLWSKDAEDSEEHTDEGGSAGSAMLRAQLGPTLSLAFPMIITELTFRSGGYESDPSDGAMRGWVVGRLLLLCRDVVGPDDLRSSLADVLGELNGAEDRLADSGVDLTKLLGA